RALRRCADHLGQACSGWFNAVFHGPDRRLRAVASAASLWAQHAQARGLLQWHDVLASSWPIASAPAGRGAVAFGHAGVAAWQLASPWLQHAVAIRSWLSDRGWPGHLAVSGLDVGVCSR